MDGPIELILPNSEATPWAVFAVKPGDVSKDQLTEADTMAREVGPKLAQCVEAERACLNEERQLGQTRGGLDALLTKLRERFQKLWLPSLDELIDTLDACDSLALSERLQPHDYHIRFVADAKGRLEVRIRAARLRRFQASLERCKIEALESQLLAVISHGRTVAALGPVFAEEGEVSVIGKRTEGLRAIAREKMRQVTLSENALRDERNRQLADEQARMATGTVTRAQVASAVPAYQGNIT